MAGHNKWSKIKRKKAGNDAKRSKIWARITRDIMIAARDGGGDPGMNARLALAVDKAKAENMPKDNIERAIKRGTGEIAGADYEELVYEGYAPGGVAVLIEALTDNTNRTVADVRSLFSKAGGNLGTSGSVAYLFEQRAAFEVPDAGLSEDDLFLLVADAGAEGLRHEPAAADGEEAAGAFVIEAPVEAFGDVQAALADAGIEPAEAALQQIPTTTVALDAADAARVLRLLDALDDHADIQAVYSTLDVDDEALAALEG